MQMVRASACCSSLPGSSFSHSSTADVAPTVSLRLTTPQSTYIAGSFVHIRRRTNPVSLVPRLEEELLQLRQ